MYFASTRDSSHISFRKPTTRLLLPGLHVAGRATCMSEPHLAPAFLPCSRNRRGGPRVQDKISASGLPKGKSLPITLCMRKAILTLQPTDIYVNVE
jgi:hypothetical protein